MKNTVSFTCHSFRIPESLSGSNCKMTLLGEALALLESSLPVKKLAIKTPFLDEHRDKKKGAVAIGLNPYLALKALERDLRCTLRTTRYIVNEILQRQNYGPLACDGYGQRFFCKFVFRTF